MHALCVFPFFRKESLVIEYITAPAPRFLLRFIEVERILNRSKVFSGGHITVAELGPGLGDIAAWIADKDTVCEVRLIESSSEAQNILKQRFIDNNKVSVISEFANGVTPADLFLTFEVLEHIENDAAMLGAIHSVMRSGALLVGSVPAYMKKWQSVDDVAGHVRRYEREEIERKLLQAGFSNIVIETYGFPVTNILFPLRQIYFNLLASRAAGRSKEESTGKSGISRGLLMGINKAAIYNAMRVAAPLQRIPLLRNMGDGFIFYATA